MERIRMCITCDQHRAALAPPFAAAVFAHPTGAARAGSGRGRNLQAMQHSWRNPTAPQMKRQMKEGGQLASRLTLT